ncbi:subtilisin-like protein [Anaeromyces robustus]|uniref:Subtilisin-like protein n=1 Tax=Anaeromyces robustus TaxID=1754192 RepID=A0A1Y1WNS8_9FUNG|nr:subtilisin-like protein [Anaeromyces robustus]|eukprot:ORX75191.1 subtilisin-like protein [Anaeromyces robustus]
MNKHFILFIIVFLVNCFVGINAENDYYIVAILRNSTDGYYDDESISYQKTLDKFINDKMNDIYTIIDNNKESYILKNGMLDKKLDELDNINLKKRHNNINQKILFINERRSNYHLMDHPSSNSKKKVKKSLNIDYIPFESNIVRHLCPINNYIAIVVYLSEKTKEKICNLDYVLYCEKDYELTEEGVINWEEEEEKEEKYDINDNNNNNNNNNNKKLNKKSLSSSSSSSTEIYYDIEAIKKETKWKNVSVQSYKFKGYPNYLALISQSPNLKKGKTFDENFYYPSSAGYGIDIYFIDSGIIVNHDKYDTYKGTSYERNITCDALTENDKIRATITSEEKIKCVIEGIKTVGYPDHGIGVTSVAGGKLLGVAKKANLHMIASKLSYVLHIDSLDFILKNAIPHKTVINISRGSTGYSAAAENKINELVRKGFIIIVSANNNSVNCCQKKPFHYYPGHSGTISVGAIDTSLFNNEYQSSYYTNFGNCVDIFAPGNATEPNLGYYKKDYIKIYGTSFAAPLVAGVAATIMSENPNIEFDQELMRKTLIDLSIKDKIKGLGSKDTPNRLLNNGKKIVFSPDCYKNKFDCDISYNTSTTKTKRKL